MCVVDTVTCDCPARGPLLSKVRRRISCKHCEHGSCLSAALWRAGERTAVVCCSWGCGARVLGDGSGVLRAESDQVLQPCLPHFCMVAKLASGPSQGLCGTLCMPATPSLPFESTTVTGPGWNRRVKKGQEGRGGRGGEGRGGGNEGSSHPGQPLKSASLGTVGQVCFSFSL